MKHRSNLKVSLLLALALGLPVAAQAATLTKTDYKAGKDRISADYKADKQACSPMSGNAKDICVEEAKAKEKVARAELEYSYSGKPADQAKIQEVKAKTAYDVAKEKCDDKKGNDKDVCVQEAKAARDKALADARMGKQMGEAKRDANEEKRDADYKLAMEKCDAMSGDAKTHCTALAKEKYGKP